MFTKIITIFLSLFAFSYASNNDAYYRELQRQYQDYRQIFKKQDNTPNGFEIFIENVHRIDSYNKENPNCRMYLTQHSDTIENEPGYNTCNSRISG